ncbi:MAG: ribosome small subunit-dependent GTPase A [Gammaproteobacteria bacterium]|jgi:ribosome biogenesis GTPase / thiamine phosphate phosphatase|nr:ribosome small subunit-dependent GTPase A [Gammaproteobacteria bacterium]MBT5825495.1 ribosome small subunit-dependent GTPase A [Gammaproteobacteria bacterium]MBT5966889.1 ribosome small subunit-dependent GTPase A [Gammaproteobacteria bacterium]MBT6419354.1 ribosome small subunit-dependent GTPase A [Gammaproteobacteria bacterium]MBT6575427.1 ribosome small subunit-dependent GTPase A [Gammaproteobacteria bacterium]
MSDLHSGLVISHLGQGIAVEVDGTTILCQTLRKVATVATGDRVRISIVAKDQGRIEELLPRHSLLERPNKGKRTRPVAANIDQIFVVFANEPYCDFLLIDQYLAICENRNIDALLIYNKSDLDLVKNIEQELKDYLSLGYSLFRVSAKENVGIENLKQALQDKISIFTGQSGVGKSSLTNTLIPDKDLKTNTVSAITKHGRHTTTAATLYHLPDSGDLIDSPGVAIFGLAGMSEQQLANGYREFQPFIEQCKFNNCRHVKDKGCAVRDAVEAGTISKTRYQRYLKLREKMPTD